MITAWTKNCKTQEDKVDFERSYLNATSVLKRLKELIYEMDVDSENKEISKDVYDSPNWDYKQADTNGYKRCLKQISKLIET